MCNNCFSSFLVLPHFRQHLLQHFITIALIKTSSNKLRTQSQTTAEKTKWKEQQETLSKQRIKRNNMKNYKTTIGFSCCAASCPSPFFSCLFSAASSNVIILKREKKNKTFSIKKAKGLSKTICPIFETCFFLLNENETNENCISQQQQKIKRKKVIEADRQTDRHNYHELSN